MTTTPAMPELPRETVIAIGKKHFPKTNLSNAWFGFAADIALATLQAQPAEVSDEEIIAIKKATKAADPTQPWGDTLAFARAILALRPQAVPMTEEQRREIFAAGYEAAEHDAAVCQVPPHGWRCTRKAGHEGPCAAVETDDAELVQRGMDRLRDITAPAGGEG